MDEIFIGLGGNGERQVLRLGRANRHGLIAGATGTGKTVTLQTIAEQFSAAGVPVFMADVKGDLVGHRHARQRQVQARRHASRRGPRRSASPTTPIATIRRCSGTSTASRGTRSAPPSREMGPLLLARLMGLNETQEGVLNIAFRYADDNGLLLIDLADLQAVLMTLRREGEGTRRPSTATSPRPASARSSASCSPSRARALTASSASRRSRSNDFIQCDDKGRGIVNILAADKLMQSPKLYATFLLWLLSELFEALPEVGDPGQAEAGVLLRRGAPAVRRRSAGAVRQGRAGRPPDPLEGRRRLFHHRRTRSTSPRRSPASSATASSTRCAPSPRATSGRSAPRPRPSGSTRTSTSRPRSPSSRSARRWSRRCRTTAAPSVVQRTLIAPPRSRLGPVTAKERAIIQSISPFDGKYDTAVDRESAAEVLAQKSRRTPPRAAQVVEEKGEEAQRAQPRKIAVDVGAGGQGGVRRGGRVSRNDGRAQRDRAQVRRHRRSPRPRARRRARSARRSGGAAFGPVRAGVARRAAALSCIALRSSRKAESCLPEYAEQERVDSFNHASSTRFNPRYRRGAAHRFACQ